MPMYQKAPKASCPGEDCPGCSSAGCYAKGGDVKGVHEDLGKYGGKAGVSPAGRSVREMHEGTHKEFNGANPKNEHEDRLAELKSMKSPELYAEGGSVNSWTKREDHEKGINKAAYSKPSVSRMGMHVRDAESAEDSSDKESSLDTAKMLANRKLAEIKGMKKPELYAEGGEVAGVSPEYDELKHAMGHELMTSIHKKDKKGIMSALEAIVLSMKGKE